MPFDDYLLGALLFGAVMGSVLGGAWLFTARRLPQLDGTVRVLALASIATCGVLAVHLVPAALGVLSRGTVVGAAVLWLLAAWLVAPVRREPVAAPGPVPGSRRLERVLAAAGVAVLVVYTVAAARNQLPNASFSVDALNFHLPGVAAWIQSGSIWQIDVYLSDVSPGHYPQNGDVVLLAAVLPWHNDFLVNVAMYPFYALTGVAVYTLARELRASRPVAIVSACLVLAIPSVAVAALGGVLVDAVMLFGFTTGILFLVRHSRTGQTSDLVLAGLALGVSFGTKWYAVSSVLIVVAVWAGASLLARRPLGVVARQGTALGGLIALAGGIWLVRNLVESANPVFPVKLAPFGVTIFDAPEDPVREYGGFNLAHYFDQPSVWDAYILPQLRAALASPSALVTAGALLAVALLLASRRRDRALPSSGIAAAGAVCAALLALAYVLTPYSAGGPEGMPVAVAADARYGVPALIVATVLSAWAASRSRPGVSVFAGLALLAVLEGARPFIGRPRAGLSDVDWAVGLGVVALGAALGVLALRLWSRLRPARQRLALPVAACGALAIVVGAGQDLQERYNGKRYRGADASIDWLLDNGRSGQRVGLTGTWSDEGISPVFPAFGPRYENEVDYVGEWRRDVNRPFRSGRRFTAALRQGGYDYLIVGRGRPPRPMVREERWAQAAGFKQVVESGRLSLYRAPTASAGPAG